MSSDILMNFQLAQSHSPCGAVGTFLCEIVVCVVELHPQGNEFICPSPSVQVSRTLTCNVSGTVLIWSVSIKGNSPSTLTFSNIPSASNDPYNINGIVGSLILKSSNILSSKLVIPDNRNLLPITIQCKESGSGAVPQEYSLKSKGEIACMILKFPYYGEIFLIQSHQTHQVISV